MSNSASPSAFDSLQPFDPGHGRQGQLYSLPALERAGIGPISRLPISIRIVLESVLRHVDGRKVTEDHVRTLANWNAKQPVAEEIPFVVARIVLQDFTGVPLLVDLAAMRSALARLGQDPTQVEPLVPVDLVVDHSVQVDFFGSKDAMTRNLDLEFKRNSERYQLLKWGQQAFQTFKVVPPGIGIVHQVNLEHLAQGVLSKAGAADHTNGAATYFPDTLVGTDSHTTMINGLGIVGWGVGGIEAEAGMLGQPVYFLTPEVVGVTLTGSLQPGVTATDLALHVTQMLREAKVVGKFVEFYGEGAVSLPVVDRATIANMAPEYGATMGFFPIDEQSVNYLRMTGRTEEQVTAFENYYRAQEMFGIPQPGQITYSVDLHLDLGSVEPCVAGPKRPQDRIVLPKLKQTFDTLYTQPLTEGGFSKTSAERTTRVPVSGLSEANGDGELGHGSVVIAAITSCTNTSNPSVMLAAGLLAKKAVERGLKVPPYVKTSLAPGSRVVSDYLDQTGLQPYLDQLGFNLVGYGCTTCIGNSGPLPAPVEEAVVQNDLIAASVLSGNRNFEARVHPNVKANFLMSPPLVVAFALAGRVDINLAEDALGTDADGQAVYLKELWPSLDEVRAVLANALKPEMFRRLYSDFANQNPMWNDIPAPTGEVYQWSAESTYIQEPPFFENFQHQPQSISEIRGARPMAIFGDSVTTDHISPAGSIKADSPAGQYLVEHNVQPTDFNSYGSRRGNDRVMTRGSFANVFIKNLMMTQPDGAVPEGGNTKYRGNEPMSIFEAAQKYAQENVPLVVFAGQEYGTGSSRDWAAKGTRLLGVRAVIAQSFERIHRSNLIGMGVLPCQFAEGVSASSLKLDGSETFDLLGLSDEVQPRQDLQLVIHRANGTEETVTVTARIDTAMEVDYYRHGGILPYVLRQWLG